MALLHVHIPCITNPGETIIYVRNDHKTTDLTTCFLSISSFSCRSFSVRKGASLPLDPNLSTLCSRSMQHWWREEEEEGKRENRRRKRRREKRRTRRREGRRGRKRREGRRGRKRRKKKRGGGGRGGGGKEGLEEKRREGEGESREDKF